MTLRSTSDGAAVVNTELFWLPIDENTPRGRKLQLIRRKDGVSHYGVYVPGSHWTHYQGVPVFAPDDEVGL